MYKWINCSGLYYTLQPKVTESGYSFFLHLGFLRLGKALVSIPGIRIAR